MSCVEVFGYEDGEWSRLRWRDRVWPSLTESARPSLDRIEAVALLEHVM